MEGILFDVSDLMNKIGRNFPLKKNFTGAYFVMAHIFELCVCVNCNFFAPLKISMRDILVKILALTHPTPI